MESDRKFPRRLLMIILVLVIVISCAVFPASAHSYEYIPDDSIDWATIIDDCVRTDVDLSFFDYTISAGDMLLYSYECDGYKSDIVFQYDTVYCLTFSDVDPDGSTQLVSSLYFSDLLCWNPCVYYTDCWSSSSVRRQYPILWHIYFADDFSACYFYLSSEDALGYASALGLSDDECLLAFSSASFFVPDWDELPDDWSASLQILSEPENSSALESILDVFSAVGVWIVSLCLSLTALFYNSAAGELTVVGVLTVLGLALSVAFLLLSLIKRWMQRE